MYLNNKFWACPMAIGDVDIFRQDITGFSCTDSYILIYTRTLDYILLRGICFQAQGSLVTLKIFRLGTQSLNSLLEDLSAVLHVLENQSIPARFQPANL